MTTISTFRSRLSLAIPVLALVAALAAPLLARTPLALRSFNDGGAEQAAPAAELFKNLRWRNLGPANMAGRVSDIEAVEANPAIVFVGAASGGVWKSLNAGTTWEPIFTKYGTS